MLHLGDFLTARYHLASMKGRTKVCDIYFTIDNGMGHGKTAASYARPLFVVLHFNQQSP